jgi:hypothetical protein
LVSRGRAERWIQDFDAAQRVVPAAWSDEYVGLRLIEAFQTLAKLPIERTAPKAFGNGWPSIVRSFADALGAEETREPRDWSWGRGREQVGPSQLSRMEAALRWPMTYLRGQPNRLKALHVWVVCRAHERSIALELRRRGIPRTTFDRYRIIALMDIRRGLVADRVPVT